MFSLESTEEGKQASVRGRVGQKFLDLEGKKIHLSLRREMRFSILLKLKMKSASLQGEMSLFIQQSAVFVALEAVGHLRNLQTTEANLNLS